MLHKEASTSAPLYFPSPLSPIAKPIHRGTDRSTSPEHPGLAKTSIPPLPFFFSPQPPPFIRPRNPTVYSPPIATRPWKDRTHGEEVRGRQWRHQSARGRAPASGWCPCPVRAVALWRRGGFLAPTWGMPRYHQPTEPKSWAPAWAPLVGPCRWYGSVRHPATAVPSKRRFRLHSITVTVLFASMSQWKMGRLAQAALYSKRLPVPYGTLRPAEALTYREQEVHSCIVRMGDPCTVRRVGPCSVRRGGPCSVRRGDSSSFWRDPRPV